LRLYDNDFAPSPRRVRMFLAEKGVTIERVQVDLGKQQNRAAQFLDINPAGLVPVLELDDGTRLTESLAICRYFEAQYPEPNLLGRTPLEAAQIEGAVLSLMFHAYVPSSQAFRNTHRYWADRVEQIPAWGEQCRASALAEWERLDARLQQQAYVVGTRFTFADIVAFTTLEFGKVSNIRVQGTQLALKRWRDEIAARPSAKA
jgi:glutathione S-transferase